MLRWVSSRPDLQQRSLLLVRNKKGYRVRIEGRQPAAIAAPIPTSTFSFVDSSLVDIVVLQLKRFLGAHPKHVQGGEKDTQGCGARNLARPPPPTCRHELPDPVASLVADLAHSLGRLAPGILYRPIIPFQARHDRTGFSAAHGDEQGGRACQRRGQLARARTRQIEANFAHGIDHLGMDTLAWMGAGGDGPRQCRVGELVENRGGHLGPAGVVNAGKQNQLHDVLAAEKSRRLALMAFSRE